MGGGGWATESVSINNGVSILIGWNVENCKGFLSPGTKQFFRNKEVSVLSGCP